MNPHDPIPRAAAALANKRPRRTARVVSKTTLAVLLVVFLVIGGGAWIYWNAEIADETYKSFIVEAGPWCGGGQVLRSHLLSDGKITRWEARAIRQAMETIKTNNRKCIDPAPEPISKGELKK
ncbi:MAG: hypothetical protein WC000_13880 [Dokdonella sp.]